MLYSVLRFISFLIFKIFFRLKVKGKEFIPKKGGFILASNHVSYLDPIALGVACPRKLNYMAKQELFSNPLISWFFSKIRIFPVKRDSADLSAIKEAMRRVKEGQPLVLFPEGSRRFQSNSTEPYPGIGFLAAKLNVPVIPVLIRGSDAALPRKAKFIRLKSISVHFGKQISIERGMPYQDIAKRIMDEIGRL
jgi:1-acyl-sn-glycerol-3-phosphate acyltransferase